MRVDLVADIGNTRAKVGVFQGDDLLDKVEVPNGDPEALRRALDTLCAGWIPRRAGLAQVSPEPAEVFAAWVEDKLKLEVARLGEDLPCPVPLEIDEPAGVGPDRQANAVWAARTYPSRSVIVIDLGTAITFDVVAARGAFVGGAIAAGLRLQARAMHEHTARLPEVRLGEGDPRPLGRSTEECLQAGVFWGSVGLIDTLCAQIAHQLEEDPLVVATGGDAKRIAARCPCVAQVVADLTLRGVRLALDPPAG